MWTQVPWSDTWRIRAAFLHRLELFLRVPQSVSRAAGPLALPGATLVSTGTSDLMALLSTCGPRDTSVAERCPH